MLRASEWACDLSWTEEAAAGPSGFGEAQTFTCLNPEDEFSVVKTGVNVCGRNVTNGAHPSEKRSQASPSSRCYGSCFLSSVLFQVALFLGLRHHR